MTIQIDERACIGCGICAAMCPIGAIDLTELGNYTISRPADHELVMTTVTDGVQEYWLEQVRGHLRCSSSTRQEYIFRAMEIAQDFDQRSYYPLIESLFVAIGVNARRSQSGDVNYRVDMELPDPQQPLPVEIKSYSESPTITIKGIQQALENKLIISRNRELPSLTAASSLVVGHEYPADRSDVDELVCDIYCTYGISIGLISTRRLYEELLRVHIDGQVFDRRRLVDLRGRF
ncbi:MAG: 4Fe-4S binding protein [Cellulomonadaceae bacterium]|nr:4Fe-4S binding protein [Cellulomonadaceae bacterium]